LVQKGYGDLKYFDEGNDTFLSKLKVEELEDYKVVEIAKVVDSKLEEDEIVVEKEIRTGVYDTRTLTLIADVNPEAIFGLTIDAWVNEDDEVFFVDVKTEDKNILVDTVKSVVDTRDKLELLVADKKYNVSDDAQIYVNFEKKDLDNGKIAADDVSDITKAYGKIVLDRGEIVFANLFQFTDNAVVTKVSDTKIEYFKTSETVRKLNLDDYDAYYIYDKNFKTASIEDIDKDSAIFWYVNDDDEIFVVVVNDKVEGELTRAKDDEITVDGNKIKTTFVGNATVSADANDNIVAYAASAEEVEDLLGEEVVVILDVNGRARHIVGDVEAVSGTHYGIVTEVFRSGRYWYADIFTKDGKKVEYKFENNSNGSDAAALFDADAPTPAPYLVVEFKLNSDGEIAKDSMKNHIDDTTTFVAVTYAAGDFDDDDDMINDHYVTDSTVLMNAEPILSDDDPELVKWDDIKKKDSAGVEAIEVRSKKDLKFVVFTRGIESAASDIEYGIVTSAPWRESKGWKVELDVFGKGKQEYFLEESADHVNLNKGDLVAFKLTTSNKIKASDKGGFKVNSDITSTFLTGTPGTDKGYTVTASVYDVDGNYVKLTEDRDWIRVSKDAVVYYTGKTYASPIVVRGIDKALSYSDIDVEDPVEVVISKKGEIVLALIYKKPATP
jgi:hypothetical protein